MRDPSHVRNYSRAGVAQLLRARRASSVADERFMQRPLEIEPWLARVDCAGEDAARVRELLGDRDRRRRDAAADARASRESK